VGGRGGRNMWERGSFRAIHNVVIVREADFTIVLKSCIMLFILVKMFFEKTSLFKLL